MQNPKSQLAIRNDDDLNKQLAGVLPNIQPSLLPNKSTIKPNTATQNKNNQPNSTLGHGNDHDDNNYNDEIMKMMP